MPPPLAPTKLGYGDVSLAPLRALRQSPSTLWRPHVHVVLPPSPCQQPWPLRPDLSIHSWSARRTPLRLSFLLPRSGLLPTLRGDAHQAPRTKTKSTVGSSHILPSRCLRRPPRLAVQLVCCARPSMSDVLQESHQTFEGLHVFGVRLLYPSRKFLHSELQLTSVLTEITGPHRPRSVAISILCTNFLAIFFIFALVGSLLQIPSQTQIHCHSCTQSECASSLPGRRRIRLHQCHSIFSERLGLPA